MTNRLPTYRQLSAWSHSDSWQILQQFADQLRTEHDDLLSGHAQPWGRTTRRAALESNRRKLKRVYAAADALGCHIGQPDAAEVAA